MRTDSTLTCASGAMERSSSSTIRVSKKVSSSMIVMASSRAAMSMDVECAGCVVRNAQQGGTWTAEERTFEMPFALQRPFTVRIEVAADAYTVRVDDAESTRFSHRRPPAEATFIECGNFKLTKLSVRSSLPFLNKFFRMNFLQK